MWSINVLYTFFLISFVTAEMTAPGIDRTMSEGIRSMGYNVVYGDEDLVVINEVAQNSEKWTTWKEQANLNQVIPPLPAEDVKCLMSVDRYCSKDMGQMKHILIEALKNDCKKCSTEEKESAGRVVASMMAHDPVAWKLFLTRSTLQILPRKTAPKEEKSKYKIVEELDFAENARNRYTMPGVKVRVKRYAMEPIN